MIFKKNISALRQTDSALADIIIAWNSPDNIEVVSSKKGLPSLKINNISLHSLYDPLKEADAWVKYFETDIDKAQELYVLGFGLGYHLLELCRISEKPVTVFEPQTAVLRKALEIMDLTSVLSRIRIITDNRIPPVNNGFAILSHKPSINLDHDYYDDIQAKLRSRETMSRGLRIIVVGPIYGGSLPVARYCSSSLIKMGHKVELIDNSRFNDALFYAKDISGSRQRYNGMVRHLSSFISEAVSARCESFRPDLVFALAQAPLTSECLSDLRQKKVTTAYWFVEDFRFMEYWKNIAGSYDFFFTIQQGQFFTELQNAGIRNYHYLPMAACPDVHKPVSLSEEEKKYYGSGLSFVGAGYYNRRHFMRGLLDFDFKIWGSDWEMNSDLAKCIQRGGARIDTEETVKIFNAAEININLHSSTYHKGINPFGDFINPRTFELPACGGFQLVDRRPALEGLFEAGEEIVVFDDLDDLRSKAAYYLDHPEERERTTELGRKRVLRDHTYENRMTEMLEVIAGKGLKKPLWPEQGENVEDLVREAGRDSELGEYLSRFAGKGNITLSDITAGIYSSEGNILRPEKMFMLMNEFVR
ncbi:MAG: glycosyltransferase [Nitrospirota bacterium]